MNESEATSNPFNHPPVMLGLPMVSYTPNLALYQPSFYPIAAWSLLAAAMQPQDPTILLPSYFPSSGLALGTQLAPGMDVSRLLTDYSLANGLRGFQPLPTINHARQPAALSSPINDHTSCVNLLSSAALAQPMPSQASSGALPSNLRGAKRQEASLDAATERQNFRVPAIN